MKELNDGKVEDIEENLNIEELEEEMKDLSREYSSRYKSEDTEYRGVRKQFFRDIDGIPLLSEEEEKEVALRAINGDENAKQILIESNYRFVAWLSERVYSADMEWEDVLQEGMLGLMKAVERYDPNKGYKFSTYAFWWVRQSIGRARDNSGFIRLPVHANEKLRQLNIEISNFISENGKHPNEKEFNEILSDLDISKRYYEMYLQAGSKVSINQRVKNSEGDDDTELGDLLSNTSDSIEDSIENSLLGEALEDAMDTVLTKKEKFVIRHRFYYGMTLESVGKELNVTRERIRQIEKKALMKLRHSYKSKSILNGFITMSKEVV